MLSLLVAAGFTSPAAASAPTGATTLVTKSADGGSGDFSSGHSATSQTGRYVSFTSYATNLVAGDTNDTSDVFVLDRQTGTTTRVSVASDGTQADNLSLFSDISADGNVVAFVSRATNLVELDTNLNDDVFVHDRQAGTTTRVSVATGGVEARQTSGGPAISADGRFVAFDSLAPLTPDDTDSVDGRPAVALARDVYVHDRQAGSTTRVSVPSTGVGSGGGEAPDISLDGRFVAFSSRAANLVAGDSNGTYDVFVRDMQSGTTTLASRATDGSQGTANSTDAVISDDGRYVAFHSRSSNLVPGDTNNAEDVFVHDRATATTTRVSRASDGTQANERSTSPDISADGRYVVFGSRASNLVAGDTNQFEDVFIHDRDHATTTRLSTATHGTQGNAPSNLADISPDGRYVAFSSQAWSLAPGDTNHFDDVFVHDRQQVPGPVPVLASVGDVSVTEGNSGPRSAVLTVSLSRPSAATVTVSYGTVDGPPGNLGFGPRATAGEDYTARSGTLSFAPGITSQPVKVAITGDKTDEGNEVFTLSLLSATGAKLSDAFGVGTTVDDDPTTALGNHLAIGDAAVHEGDAGGRQAIFTVSLTKPAPAGVTVSYTTVAGTASETGDFVGKAGTLTIAAGASSAVVKITINPDETAEAGSEGFTVALSNASGAVLADATGVGAIFDDD